MRSARKCCLNLDYGLELQFYPCVPSSNTISKDFSNTQRPASHWWAIGFFILTVFGSLLQLLHALGYGKPAMVVAGPHVPALPAFVVGVAALVGLFGGAHRPWGYYLTSVCLGSRAIFSLVLSCQLFSERIHSSVAVVLPSPGNTGIGIIVFPVLFAYLFYRYTFGRPSRSYYRLGRKMEPPPLP